MTRNTQSEKLDCSTSTEYESEYEVEVNIFKTKLDLLLSKVFDEPTSRQEMQKWAATSSLVYQMMSMLPKKFQVEGSKDDYKYIKSQA